ncbi:glycoside hydrolase family 30 protein [Athelia psychrophila]|uniref:Glycoside hydrolase family 30 protein n=1 Tax=Athelia psychrophila TaxID=1759441 RepID=A0A166FA75_9AGAM|nr:glycoside hydrolase family 30 protein [Fibularhizoctonia sp. CBS 109695]
MRSFSLVAFTALAHSAVAQQIQDIWATTWDRASLFSDVSPASPINFVTPSAIGDADIVVDDSTVYQTMAGFGGTLTDGAALTLYNMKTANVDNYWSLLGYMFDPTDGVGAAGLTYLRVPLGASDFSASLYSFDDTRGDTSFADFNINAAPSYLFSTIADIQTINNILKVHILPWSPPAWMKGSASMDGGSLDTSYATQYATYLLKCIQGFEGKSIPVYAISVQNEPENGDTTYPTTSMPVAVEAQIGIALRTLMNNNGYSGIHIFGFEHNWNDATAYPVQLACMEAANGAFDSVSFHCYNGTVDEQGAFQALYPNIDIYFTECTGTLGSDWWSDVKWYTNNLMIGAPQYYAKTAAMWNLVLDGNGQPELSGSDSCASGGCRGVATVNSDGSYNVNQEFYAMAQASRAIIPKDVGGPFGQRIGVSIGGGSDWALVVGAYQTKRLSSTDYNRYSLVVLNWDDSSSTTFNPVPVSTTIEFRGMQAAYTFPVGVTTLWWYAESVSATITTTSPNQFNSTSLTPWKTTLPSNVTGDPHQYRPRRSAPL